MQLIPLFASVAGIFLHSLVTCAVTSLQVLQKPSVSDWGNVQLPVGQLILRVEFAVPKPRRLL